MAEAFVQRRMRELGIAEDRIGAIEHAEGAIRRSFSPDERTGGTCDEFGRLYVDSGFLNPALVDPFGPESSEAWRKLRARHRIDAIIAHEDEETKGGFHETAIERAADTALPIADEARHALRAIAEAEKRRGR